MTSNNITDTKQQLSSPLSFKLDGEFVKPYILKNPKFGFNGLGELVFYRTYSRPKADGNKEAWWETIRRVVEGCYSIQKDYIISKTLTWDEKMAQLSAQEMYDRMFRMKFLPPGRGLWSMGSGITSHKGLFAALNNCGFCSTVDIDKDGAEPFCFLMDMSMLGVGVGFDSKGAGKIIIKRPIKSDRNIYIIPDTREGWVESLRLQLTSYFNGTETVTFDYSIIRPEGKPLRTFGGISSGPGPLIEMHKTIDEILNNAIKSVNDRCPITITIINDIMNLIGRCVISGNLRRSAEISFGPHDSDEFIKLKDYKTNPQRSSWGWTANNSIYAEIGMDYKKISDQIAVNGEPGLAWLSNMQAYSRMGETADYKDSRAMGGNPCLEQTLEPWELCCLVEMFPTRCKDYDDYIRTIKFAYLYAKTVTLCSTHWPKTNAVLMRNRRIGCSISGIAQFEASYGIHTLKRYLEDGYKTVQHWDKVYSDWFCIPRSIKTTSIKPSGSVSLVAGVTPSIHYPISRFYIRRINIGNTDSLLPLFKEAGYKVEISAYNPTTTSVVEFPIDSGVGIRSQNEVTMWEQVTLAIFMQRYYSDNQVSATITFKPEEGKDICHALKFAQYSLKGISFLPYLDPSNSPYPQMPYQKISEEEYHTMIKNVKTVDYSNINGFSQMIEEKFCDGDTCSAEQLLAKIKI